MSEISGEILRARTWDEYVGQDKLKARLRTHIEAARLEERTMDHMLLVGPPGYGKTTLAAIVADEIGDEFLAFTMPMKETDLARLFREWDGGVLLLDEFHRAPPAMQECLLNAIEDGWMQMPGSTSRIYTDHVTIIMATTEARKVIPTIHDRTMLQPHFEPYSEDEMTQIVLNMGAKMDLTLDPTMARQLGRAAAGTPRIAGRLIVAVRDLTVTEQEVTAETVLGLAGIDPDGLSETAVKYLQALKQLGGTSGIKNICSLLRLPESVAVDMERVLLDKNMISLEPRGRTLTAQGWAKVEGRAVDGSVAARRARRQEAMT